MVGPSKTVFFNVSALCAPPELLVLPLCAAGFVAPCHGAESGGQGQFPGTQMKDFSARRSP
ncbi:hypothetical protein C9383_04020 [Pseudomonas palleroniana]|uniref:Uncharacterized protein n=1 Tax=Pseudomonas palleroniana TaxID=191390 RepID=A0A2T4G6S8_9PSED|nr:hypothetical protein F7R03_01750 [Pseudomonas palleroniana]PTC31395.1 hypothetical protein C9383_04020 [Pseudomonas palleroniana]